MSPRRGTLAVAPDLPVNADISLLVVGGGPAGLTAALQACCYRASWD